jgi:hypothetical protein
MNLEKRVDKLEGDLGVATPEERRSALAAARRAEFEHGLDDLMGSLTEEVALIYRLAAEEPTDPAEMARVQRGLEEYFAGGDYLDGYLREEAS